MLRHVHVAVRPLHAAAFQSRSAFCAAAVERSERERVGAEQAANLPLERSPPCPRIASLAATIRPLHETDTACDFGLAARRSARVARALASHSHQHRFACCLCCSGPALRPVGAVLAQLLEAQLLTFYQLPYDDIVMFCNGLLF